MALMKNKTTVAFVAAALMAMSANAATRTAVNPTTVTTNIQSVVSGLNNAMLPQTLSARTIEQNLNLIVSSGNGQQLAKALEQVAKMQKAGKIDKKVLTNFVIGLSMSAKAPTINSELKDGRVVFTPSAEQSKAIVAMVKKEVPASQLLGLTDADIVNAVVAQVTLFTGDGLKMVGKLAGFDAFLAENTQQLSEGVQPIAAFLKAAEKTQGGRAGALALIAAIIRDCGASVK